jgi:hypothetical protein
MAGQLKDKQMVEFSEQPTSWKVIVELMTGNFVTSKVEALMYVILKQTE